MGFRQPPVEPLPDSLDFHGRTVVVTGASAGLGLEFCRQFLQRGVSNLILAVRNVSKGEKVQTELLADPTIKGGNPNGHVRVMKLEAGSYDSIKSFTKEFTEHYRDLDILMLNAGIGPISREETVDGHEKTVEVNYLSNVLLFIELAPILEATAERNGRPSRVSITGSRMSDKTSVDKANIGPYRTIVSYLDDPKEFEAMSRYGDSKYLVLLFVRELAKRYDPTKIIVNNFCPGMCHTDMTNTLPIYIRLPVILLKVARARKNEVGAWVALHAAAVAGAETHGQLLGDKEIHPMGESVLSQHGAEFQKRLWKETMDEMAGLTTLPEWAKVE